ncbi:hypothetical protein LTR86_005896 [Recurvomyces mirabilis]|nr:hypothetical protein LTR86_005896 [Recurvomyces mirabilis]
METLPKDQWLLPAILDHRARTTPDDPYCMLPRGNNLTDGFFELSYAAMARAVDRTAWWLDEVLGQQTAHRSSTDAQAVPYIGPDDLRYFLPNTVEGLTELLRLTDSTVVLAPNSHKHMWSSPIETHPAKEIDVPSLEYFVEAVPTKKYEFTQTLTNSYDDGAILCQTSGTTGKPKPIKMTNGNIADYILAPAVESRQAAKDTDKLAVFAVLERRMGPILTPMSWAATPLIACWAAFAGDYVPIFLPHTTAPRPPTAEYIIDMTKSLPRSTTRELSIFAVPDLLRQLVRSNTGRECLRQYAVVEYGGAPLDHETGDIIHSMGVRVQSFIGSTDSGIYPTRFDEPGDWKVARFEDGYQGYEMEQFHDDLYELVIRHQGDDPRFCFQKDPGLKVFRTRDLWREVPGRKKYWSNAGRVDDFVKLSSLTKFNAIAIEQMIEADGNIAKCVVAGDSRSRPFVLVEPAARGDSEGETLKMVLPALEAANKHLLSEAHLLKDLVLLTDPDIPIIRTGKGTVSRRATLDVYERRIETLYTRAGFEAVPFKATGEAMTNGH